MINEERKALVERVRGHATEAQLGAYYDDDTRQMDQAADQIEADGQRIAELEAALRRISEFSPANMWRGTDVRDIARAALGDKE